MTDETTDDGASDTDDETGSNTDRETVDDPVESIVPDDDKRDPDPALGSNTSENPFDELGPASEDTTDMDNSDDAFERVDVGDPGDEDVWELLDEGADKMGSSDPEFGSTAAAGASNQRGASAKIADSSDVDREHADRDVDKRAYCQQCPHFSAPPEAVCTHEGTTIVEVVDIDEFRVRNCPLVSKADRAAESARDI